MAESFPLNDAQRTAVEHPSGPALVIAGAGSGKTRVLTARIAALLERGVRPEAILAFTFTNRAAKEMRERTARSVGPVASKLWIGTFHATAVRLLRREYAVLGLPQGFAIYDREDQEGVLRDIIKDMALNDTAYRLGTVLSRISECKNALVTPEEALRAAMDPYARNIAECYRRYQAALRRAGALDFDDLIAETVRLFLQHPEVGERWSRRFEHVLVDEYQDTNNAQFRLVQALAAVHGNLFVVGDDDQSIYGWRGADLRNVLDFERAFPGAVTIRLEQNYRSTNNILKAANAVVANNQARKGKTLWSEREDGALLTFALCRDEADEARRVRRWIETQRARGRPLSQCAVLDRTIAQSRSLEVELSQAGIPYEIVGGVSFFQRREVKDLLAHLRLLVNPADLVSFWRIWNTPRRGLGPAVEAQVEARLAAGMGTPFDALRALVVEGALRGPARAGAAAFLAMFDDLEAHREEALDMLFARVLEKSGYRKHLESTCDDQQDLMDRGQNVEELGAFAGAFAATGRGGLMEFLSECSLLTDADRLAENVDRALLLTAHNAKGLEFDTVAVAGLEEGLLPHASALKEGRNEASQLEEERRLFYVALTRARDEVLLTAAAYRRRFDGAWGAQVSRFVEEIPAELLRREGGVQGPAFAQARPLSSAPRRASTPRDTESSRWGDGRTYQKDDVNDLAMDLDDMPGGPSHGVSVPARTAASRKAVGQRVRHDRFGAGVVVGAEGEGPDMKLEVRFSGSVKKVLARFVSGGDDGD